MSETRPNSGWGQPPWKIDFQPAAREIPSRVDFAIVGGGFAGLAAAAWLRHIAPEKSAALFEAHQIGSGASGSTGGMALAETAAGDLLGLGDVLDGTRKILDALQIDCGLQLPGTWEIGRKNGRADSPLSWNFEGVLKIVNVIPGGTLDPGRLLSGLARAAENSGALVIENAEVEKLECATNPVPRVNGKEVCASRVLIATGAQSLELSGLKNFGEPKFTVAIATKPLEAAGIEVLGLSSGRSFYTLDLPYLWGRMGLSSSVIFGGGLMEVGDWRELAKIDIAEGQPAEMIANLERRVRELHPALKAVEFSHWWGGPILISRDWRPVFKKHSGSENVFVLGGFSGHGVALGVYLGAWAAEAMLGRRELPSWNAQSKGA